MYVRCIFSSTSNNIYKNNQRSQALVQVSKQHTTKIQKNGTTHET
ncbi:37521_t:CDS:2 [Gigaspora margarita]|uniref:37521_t:CDS:1 n=1 Tax=Gigaspora margarita TaxID=4874 RepID=A0ABN7UJ02_GIGMA|nr:37521_t:CDS:2 [Gigaspora margarita]